jgi:hypothetical protein
MDATCPGGKGVRKQWLHKQKTVATARGPRNPLYPGTSCRMLNWIEVALIRDSLTTSVLGYALVTLLHELVEL